MKKVIIIVVAIFCMPFMAGAWGVLGHRIVGEIADHYLSAKARKGIQQLVGNESIAMAANWADFIKSDTSYNYLNNWHYVNLKSDLSRNDVFNFLDQQTGPNVYNRIDAMVVTLKDKKSTSEQKKFALRMLLHLVGDLHQPMHTARFEDLGGNRISLTWFGERSNLHRVWDESLIDFQQLSYSEYVKAINHPTAAQFTTWQKSTLKECVYESYEICNRIYAAIKSDDKLSYKYNFDWIETVNQQLLKGGVRLAKILNDIYKVG